MRLRQLYPGQAYDAASSAQGFPVAYPPPYMAPSTQPGCQMPSNYAEPPRATSVYCPNAAAPLWYNTMYPRPAAADPPTQAGTDSPRQIKNRYTDGGSQLAVVVGAGCCCFMVLLTIVMAAVFVYGSRKATAEAAPSYTHWAVVSDAKDCAVLAKDIFDNNGGLGDAAVAVLLCMGVTAPHLMGLGGGFVALYYDNSKRTIQALDALGVSPAAATEDVFASEPDLSLHGAKYPIVPGALSGYKLLHEKLGKFAWKDLFGPAIGIAKNGFDIGPHLAAALSRAAQDLEGASALKSRFWNKHRNALLRQGERLVQPTMANLLEQIGQHGADYLYKGVLADEISRTLANVGGLMNSSDLRDYKATWRDAIGIKMASGKYLYSAPFPGCGAILAAAVHKNLWLFFTSLCAMLQRQENLMYAIIAKADKFMNGMSPLAQSSDYGLRHAPELDFGGAHLSILAPNGDALSITSGLNGSHADHRLRPLVRVSAIYPAPYVCRFGSMFVTPSGLLLNNYMAAFAKPGRQLDLEPSPANRLGPGKRPLTSMVPTIITEGKAPANIFGIFGASGGLEGLSAMAQVTPPGVHAVSPIPHARRSGNPWSAISVRCLNNRRGQLVKRAHTYYSA
ncbi:glutathione hydrolase 1 proenzyme [Dermacentor silvarum]|uniref:glutathione hydrolase 1 proenzyme n=1 Tax=Dermacentor silvarum TaxID=543639 RepID=UPI0021007A37|nr:glutathione hydrolase 1 proenzyme [Dermacentor silvarum]